MADTAANSTGATETPHAFMPAPKGSESNEAIGPGAIDTATTSSNSPVPAELSSEQKADLEHRNDVLSGEDQGGPLPGGKELHQTMDQMNQGINEIAASVRTLCSKFSTLPVQSTWPIHYRPPPQPPFPFRSRSVSSASSISRTWMRPPAVLEAKVREYDWENFMNRFSDEHENYAIEVLVSGPDLQDEINQEKKKRGEKAPKPETEEVTPEASSTRKPWIQQVRIQSSAILSFLRMLLGKEAAWWDADVKTFKRPFRAFILLQSKAKVELEKIEEYLLRHPTEAKHEQTSTASEIPAESSEHPTTENEVARLDAPARSRSRSRSRSPMPTVETEELTTEYIAQLPGALEQIRCYVEFVDKDILPFYQEFENIDPKKPPKFRFEDLWYVFRVGELLYTPRQKDSSQKQDKKENQDKQNEQRRQTSAWEDHDVATRQTIWRIHGVHIPGDEGKFGVTSSVNLLCHYIDFDGTEFGAVEKEFQLRPYDDERNLTALAAYPLKFAANAAQILDQAKVMGRKFLASIHNRHGAYSGWTLLHDPQGLPMPNTSGDFTRTPEHINSEIIVDFHEGLNQSPWWKPSIFSGSSSLDIRTRYGPTEDRHIVWSDKDRKEKLRVRDIDIFSSDGMHDYEYQEFMKDHKYLRPKAEDDRRRTEPEGEDIALLPRRIIGYALWERKFVLLDLNFLDQMAVTARDNAFDKLEIDHLHKRLIQSIVSAHFKSRDIEKGGKGLGTQDIIRGKGKGLVLLLHGVPGVGKTATAEAVAQKWGKPLFPITCGDLGLTPESVEKSLNGIFRLAHLWDCVLLLDEADVFISRRTHGSDLQRNALVSVFLRMLEYYNGILFLTTNLPGYLDEAVKSRVHLNLRYDALTLEQVKGIFRLNINQLNEIERERSQALGTTQMDIFEEEIIDFAEDHWKSHTEELGRWNGRQIRNAFSIASSLAHFDAEGKAGRAVQLRKCHFQEVQKATVLYDRYRYSILTASDGDRAKQSEARNDDFNERTFTQRGNEAAQGSALYSRLSVQNTPSRAQGPYEQRGASPQPTPSQPALGIRNAPESAGFSQNQQAGYHTPRQKQPGFYPPPQASPNLQERPGGYPPTPQDFYPTQHTGVSIQQHISHSQTSSLPYRDDVVRDLQGQTGYGQAQATIHGSGHYTNL
ncbi:hypothetical protein N8I77_000794 [Diaporthe amygdali]|uniref:AAA+ ATPase domain-containing protein n=1 Tax=Phomopsis amygdali TaxID=1214568 RepID=A0AAD9SP44_PHOAM|nr:hypothetical protein N8I77_000794 [Diaporthe amygdali]